MLNYKIKVMGYMEAFRYVYNHCGYDKNKDFAILSIQEYDQDTMGIEYKPGGHLKAALNINFSDINSISLKMDDKPYVKLMTDEDAVKIKNYIDSLNKRDNIDELIIHCHAGVSRSSAVAAAILKVFNNDDSDIFNAGIYAPNMFVYNKILKVYGMENNGSAFLLPNENNDIIF